MRLPVVSRWTMITSITTISSLSRRMFPTAGAFTALPPVSKISKTCVTVASSSHRLWSSTGTNQQKEEVDPGAVAGTTLRIVKYPHPSLRAENMEISEDELRSGDISKLAKEMFLLMYAAEGVGLAAPQVGVNKRLMVYNPTGDKTKWLDETVLVNPRIVTFSDGRDVDIEGCLSFPDMNGDVERSKWIKVEAMSLKGKKMKKKFKGWEARIFQHEYDHLDGVVYIDRLSEEDRNEIQPKLDALVEGFGDGAAL
mmetsp:Transcript_36476/g.44588  ORF Transcript_36476/g.44588 Transcript_36476/m.44588 type:complete len:254 (-) Transcript_36476:170-931(-)